MRTLLLVLVLAAPAAACLNDREVVERDRRFRSGYGEAPVAAAAVPGASSPWPGIAMLGTPLILAVVGVFLAKRSSRR